jgi:fluoride exporter
MGPYLIIFAGAGLGGMARHGVNMAAARLGYAFPWGTFAVNVGGSFLMGVLAAWFALRTGVPQHVKLFLTTGLLGGFTTFSAFSLDAALMWERGAFASFAAYALASVALSVAGLFAGMAAVRLLA